MPLENKFSRHFFFASRRKKECGCPYGQAEKEAKGHKARKSKSVQEHKANVVKRISSLVSRLSSLIEKTLHKRAKFWPDLPYIAGKILL
jgi:hypothetical protein